MEKIFPNIDFISDLKAFAIQQLRYHKVDFDESDTAHGLFMRMDLFYKHFIKPKPRKVVKSSKINKALLSDKTF